MLKEGFAEDPAAGDKLAKLLRFASTAGSGDAQEVSLADYIARMKEGQAAIYYVTAESHAAAANSPHLEIFRKKGIEVLLLSDRIDEWVASGLSEFEGKPLTSVARGALDLGALADSEEKAQQEKEAGEMQPLVERLAKALGEKVKEVRVTFRLTDSPACLVVGEGDVSGNLERLLKSVGQKAPTVVPTLEVNPHHALVQRLSDGVRRAARRVGAAAVRPGAARGGRAPRRPRGVRASRQHADAGTRRLKRRRRSAFRGGDRVGEVLAPGRSIRRARPQRACRCASQTLPTHSSMPATAIGVARQPSNSADRPSAITGMTMPVSAARAGPSRCASLK